MCSVLCTGVQCTLYSLGCAVYCVQVQLFSVHSAVQSVQRACGFSCSIAPQPSICLLGSYRCNLPGWCSSTYVHCTCIQYTCTLYRFTLHMYTVQVYSTLVHYTGLQYICTLYRYTVHRYNVHVYNTHVHCTRIQCKHTIEQVYSTHIQVCSTDLQVHSSDVQVQSTMYRYKEQMYSIDVEYSCTVQCTDMKQRCSAVISLCGTDSQYTANKG